MPGSTPVRFASFNASLNRSNAGDLIADLSTPTNEQAQTVAEIIQRTNPDVLLVNEFDYDPDGTAADLFRQNYLAVSQNGQTPVEYPYLYLAPSNTGIPSGADLDNDGSMGGPGDAFGFGFFPGQFAMVLFSKFPIDTDSVRTFQTFLWQDMPGALLPADPEDADSNGDTSSWYTAEELDLFRLSSKSHWDVPVEINGETVHVLASHPTPPVFDGAEDRNGTRNFDEIRFWADYVAGADYIYDDQGITGGLAPGARFVIMGDQNADPFDGDSIPGAIQQLLENPRINIAITPGSAGGPDAAQRQGSNNLTQQGDPAFDTADFGEAEFGGPGNLRVDYVLPSANLGITDAAVFWPTAEDPLFDLVGDFPFPSSDHRLVYADVADTLPNGVASGDVTQDSVVLWTRSTVPGTVTFEYATDATFSAALSVTATVSDPAEPVKVDVTGLTPATGYFYRVTDAAGNTDRGQFRTAAALGQQSGLTFGIAGDWQQAPPYPILTSAAQSDLDFFVKLGDTIYADLETPALPGITQARTLEEFRIKHSEVLSPRFGLSALADLYGTTSVYATIDDHEVVDNFAGGAAPGESPDAPDIGSSPDPLFTDAVDFVNDTQAYEDALQAYQEYHPLQDRFYDTPEDPRTDGERQLYRAQSFGSDGALFVLDSRSFRDVQLPPADLANPGAFLASAFDPERTLLGRAQVDLLKQDLLSAEADGVTWKFVVIPEPIQNFGVVNAEDRFEGYAAERTEILKFIEDNAIDNVVFMAGDFHGTIVNNLTYQEGPGQAQVATGAFEIVTGPVAFFDGRFGPNVASISAAAGLIDQEQLDFYNALPVAPDTDDLVNDKDDFIKQLLVAQTDLFGYDPVGLESNLAAAEGRIDATLLQGDYVAAHAFSWTELDVDPVTQALTVTTFGIDAYSEADLLADPQAVLDLTPRIVSQFVVNPQNVTAADNFLSFGQYAEAVSALFGVVPPAVPVQVNGLELLELVDEAAYLRENVDVAEAVAAGVFTSGYDHFTQFGWLEGRDPSLLVDNADYLEQNPDVAAAVAAGAFSSGIQHFFLFGHTEGRDPSALFSQSQYLAANGDVAAAVAAGAFGSGFEHFLAFGIAEGRGPEVLLYDEAFYLAANGDVAAAVAAGGFADGYGHYLAFGAAEGRSPSALFAEADYLAANGDVAAAVASEVFPSGFAHYVAFGRGEARPVAS